jgi:hypothetical protein
MRPVAAAGWQLDVDAGVRRTRRPSGSINCSPASLASAAICCDTVDVVNEKTSATFRIEPSRDKAKSSSRRRVSTKPFSFIAKERTAKVDCRRSQIKAVLSSAGVV